MALIKEIFPIWAAPDVMAAAMPDNVVTLPARVQSCMKNPHRKTTGLSTLNEKHLHLVVAALSAGSRTGFNWHLP